MKNIRLVVVAILFLGIASQAQDTKTEASLTQNPIYHSNCAKCHGKTAEGRFMAGPSLVSDKARALSGDDLTKIITKGKHRMPKFEGKLSPADIQTLVDEIKSQKK